MNKLLPSAWYRHMKSKVQVETQPVARLELYLARLELYLEEESPHMVQYTEVSLQ